MPHNEMTIMSPDPESAKRVLEIFGSPPALRFEGMGALNLQFPHLNSRASERLNSFHGPFDDLFVFSTRKHRFDQPAIGDWNEFVQFPNSKLSHGPGGGYSIVEAEDLFEPGVINSSRRRATSWLQTEWASFIKASPGGSAAFATGVPGSGKSTLFKMLLNQNRGYLRGEKIIASRFESLKFDIFRRARPRSEALAESLTKYLYRILLRDIVYYLGYDHDPSRRPSRDLSGDLSGARLDHVVSTYSMADPNRREEDAYILRESMHRSDVDFKRLLGISEETVIGLVNFFARSYSLVIVFDGLDFFTPAHSRAADPGYRTLKNLVNSFVLHGGGYESDEESERLVSLPFHIHCLFVLRDSTYSKLVEDRLPPIGLIEYKRWRVKGINPRVALYNAVRRGTRELLRREHLADADEAERIADRIMHSVDGLLAFIARQLRLSRRTGGGLFELFQGDMRQCYLFIGRVLSWIVNIERRKLFDTDRPIALRSAVDFASSPEVVNSLRRRGHRIFEFLACGEGRNFENAVVVLQQDAGSVALGQVAQPSGIRINPLHESCIDNVFNYHVLSHPRDADFHCLLEKVRILQVADKLSEATSGQIVSYIENNFGYDLGDANRLGNTLSILLLGGYLDVRVSGGANKFRTTSKGLVCIRRLIFEQRYLEHVFHCTLFPGALISHIENSARHVNPAAWVVNSIHNSFVFLAYVTFVENNRAGGKSIPDEFVIQHKIRKALVVSTKRLLSDRRSGISHGEAMSDEVWRLIERTLNAWTSAGIVVPAKE